MFPYKSTMENLRAVGHVSYVFLKNFVSSIGGIHYCWFCKKTYKKMDTVACHIGRKYRQETKIYEKASVDGADATFRRSLLVGIPAPFSSRKMTVPSFKFGLANILALSHIIFNLMYFE